MCKWSGIVFLLVFFVCSSQCMDKTKENLDISKKSINVRVQKEKTDSDDGKYAFVGYAFDVIKDYACENKGCILGCAFGCFVFCRD